MRESVRPRRDFIARSLLETLVAIAVTEEAAPGVPLPTTPHWLDLIPR